MSKPNATSLALRDPAMAAMVGLIASSNFGHEQSGFGGFAPESVFAPGDEADSDYGAEFGADFDPAMGFGFGAEGFGFGADFGATKAVAHVPRPTEAQAMALWAHHHNKMAHQNRRKAILEPNANSEVKVERYNMQVSETFVFNTPKTFTDLTVRPTVNFRPQVVFMNAPTPMFGFVSAVLVSNVNTFVGSGEEDAFDYNANGWGKQMDMPTLTPAIPFTVNARYTGFTPPGFVGGTTNTFSVSAKGPASIVA